MLGREYRESFYSIVLSGQALAPGKKKSGFFPFMALNFGAYGTLKV